MNTSAATVALSSDERAELEGRVRARKLRADAVKRARMILMLADGASYAEITKTLGYSSATISLWKKRFLEQRLPGLESRHKGSKPRV